MPKQLKSYPPTWKGDLLLACKECQKKLKGDNDLRALAKLKKTIRHWNKEHPDALLHVINVPCMDLCPSKGVAICDPSSAPHRLLVLQSEHDVQYLSS